MSDLVIVKANEVYAKVNCEKSIAKELHEFFSFMVPGYQFVPAYRNRVWDGKIYLYHLNTSQIYLGLAPYLKQFCEERGYTYEMDDSEDEFSVYHAKKFIEKLNIHSNGAPIQVREHQLHGFIHAMQSRRALLLSPTASGKSLIIYLIFRQLLDYQNLKGLIIVPTTSLVEQLYSDFSDYSSEDTFKTYMYVHRIYQGKEKHTNKPLTISTWQSLYKMPKEYFEQFDYIIGDEAHQFKAQSLTSIMSSATKTKYRIGLTGTLDGTKTHKLVLEGLFGPVKQVTTTRELIDKKQISEFEIKCLILKHDEESFGGKLEYKDEIQYLITSEPRNKFIKNLAVSLGKNTLILYQMVEKHGQILYDMIKSTKNIGDRKVFFIHGGVETDEREEIRRIMEIMNEDTIIFDFDDFEIIVNKESIINLTNKTSKKAVDIIESDDIDTSVIINKIQASTLKGIVIWKKNN